MRFGRTGALLCLMAAAAGPLPDLAVQVAELDRTEPAIRPALEQRLGGALHCEGGRSGRTDCRAAGVALGGVPVGSVELRTTAGRGALLILEGLGADCIPVAAFNAAFGEGTDGNACTDGVVCLYRSYGRPWGRLSVRLGTEPATAGCVSSVVLDSYPR